MDIILGIFIGFNIGLGIGLILNEHYWRKRKKWHEQGEES